MAVPLTAKDISRLMNAATIMLSPLDFPTGESWVKSVCRALQEVVDADAASELASCFRFSKREIECALLLKNGASSKQIAATMGISVNTARRHVERILLKLNVHSRAAAAAALHSPSSLHRS